MLKNNIYALLFHLLSILPYCLFLFLTSFRFQEAGYPYFIFAAIYFISCFILGNFLRVQSSTLKNFLSVASIFLVGIAAYGLIWFFLSHEFMQFVYLYVLVAINILCLHTGTISEATFNYLVILFMLLPTLLIWLGLQWKAYRIGKTQNSGNNYQG